MDLSRHEAPLRICITRTSFSHPNNFVLIHRDSDHRGTITTIDDPMGAWMNQGGTSRTRPARPPHAHPQRGAR